MTETTGKPMSIPHLHLRDTDLIVVKRTPAGVEAWIHRAGGRPSLRLPHVGHQSATGFEYGYDGYGPAALAWSILAVCTHAETAEELHELFKRDRVARETADRWMIKAGTVREWVAGALVENDHGLVD